jgi:hypothetical protein
MVDLKYDKSVRSKVLLTAIILLEKYTGVKWGHFTPKLETYFISSAEYPVQIGALRPGRKIIAPGIKFDLILRSSSSDKELNAKILRELFKGLKNKLPESILAKFDQGELLVDPMADSFTAWAVECPILL